MKDMEYLTQFLDFIYYELKINNIQNITAENIKEFLKYKETR